MHRLVFAAGILLVLLPSAAAARYIEVRITDKGFDPQQVEINPGETVVFVNTDDEPHWVASNDHPTHMVYPGSDIRLCGTDAEKTVFDSCRGLEKEETYSFTFDSPGTWKLHDHLNSTFTASVVVAGEPAAKIETGSTLSLRMRTHAFLRGLYYRFASETAEAKLNSLNLITLTRNDADLEYWMRVFGSKPIFDELVRDANDPSQRPDTPDDQNKVTQCHVEAHYAGRMAYLVYGFDSLTENLLDTRCAFGFYHGTIEMALGIEGDDGIVKRIAEQCEQYEDEPMRRAFCYHAVGHGVAIYHNLNIPEAILACKDLMPTDTGRRVCYHGAFMENAFAAGGVGVGGHSTSWSDRNHPDFPCTSPALLKDRDITEMCWTDQSFIWWSYNRGVDMDIAIAGCERAPAEAKDGCYAGIGFNMSFAWRRTLSNEEIVANCRKLPNQIRTAQCLLGALVMRSTHWGEFDGFTNPTFCSAMGFDDPSECDAFTREQYSWIGNL